MSRREVLRRAGWVVPAIVALPLVATPAHATRRKRSKYASPGGTGGYKSKSGSGWNYSWGDKKWKTGGFLNFFNWFKF